MTEHPQLIHVLRGYVRYLNVFLTSMQIHIVDY